MAISSYYRCTYGNYSETESTVKYNEQNNSNGKEMIKGVSTAVQTNPYSGTSFKVASKTSGANVFNLLDSTAGKVKDGVARGASVFRVDGPHGKVTYNHFNTNSSLYPNNKIYQALNHKKISSVTYNIGKNAGKITKTLKVGGRAVAVAAAIMDGKEIYDAYKKDGNKVGENTITTTSGVAGSWVGAIGGAKAGATGGAAIGTMICPGLGTTIGGIIGGFIGGIVGAIGGKTVGEGIAKEVMNR
ncbi:MAG: hypothetical protein J6J42_00840 [Lachnospiraceae bacterium]|nr:hypothetical protein [Lachnospiraceae bacterium]